MSINGMIRYVFDLYTNCLRVCQNGLTCTSKDLVQTKLGKTHKILRDELYLYNT